VALARDARGNWEERSLPAQLPSNRATVVEIRGNVFFASVYSFDELLPTPDEASNAVVILRARDHRISSLTGLGWLEKYSARLQAADSKLILSGVGDDLMKTLETAEAVERLGAENIFCAERRLFASTEKALEAAKSWIEDSAQGS
jgi:SulP family sulfate permease